MSKPLIIFVAQCFLLIVGCHNVGSVVESPDSKLIKQTSNVASVVPTSDSNAELVRESAPTPERRVAKVDMVRTGLYHSDNPRLGEHYKPFWIEDEQSDNGFEPFCVQRKIKGKRIEKCGYQDAEGKVLVKPMFKIVYVFSEGLAGVCPKQDGLCGYINERGKLVIKWYQCNDKFSEGLAVICIGDTDYYKYGYINKKGKYVIRPQYSNASAFRNGIAEVTVQRSLNKCINKENENVECAK